MKSSSRSSRRPPASGDDLWIPRSIRSSLERSLRVRTDLRDRLAEDARNLRRGSQNAMREMHRGGDGKMLLQRLTPQARRVIPYAASREAGVVDDALQEWTEAHLLSAFLRGESPPAPGDLGVPAETYLAGVGDLVGEVRRLVLGDLTRGDLARATERFGAMEGLFHFLLGFESPRSILALKPKQDSARSLVERTRSELALARILSRAAPPGAGAPAPEMTSEAPGEVP